MRLREKAAGILLTACILIFLLPELLPFEIKASVEMEEKEILWTLTGEQTDRFRFFASIRTKDAKDAFFGIFENPETESWKETEGETAKTGEKFWRWYCSRLPKAWEPFFLYGPFCFRTLEFHLEGRDGEICFYLGSSAAADCASDSNKP